MDSFSERARRARSIVESCGGMVRDRNGWLMCVEVPEDAVWKLRALNFSYAGRFGDRMLFDVDLRPVPLRAVGGSLVAGVMRPRSPE